MEITIDTKHQGVCTDLTLITPCTPRDRLMELQNRYNNMEYRLCTPDVIEEISAILDELTQIVTRYPDLLELIELKRYQMI